MDSLRNQPAVLAGQHECICDEGFASVHGSRAGSKRRSDTDLREVAHEQWLNRRAELHWQIAEFLQVLNASERANRDQLSPFLHRTAADILDVLGDNRRELLEADAGVNQLARVGLH